MHRSRPALLAALAASTFALPMAAQAQAYPVKSVRLIVPFAPGGTTDIVARIVSEKMGAALGQTVVVENKGGAGGNIAHGQVANAVADGSVILFGSVGPLAIAPHLMKLNYDPFKDLAPLSGGVNFPNVLVAHKGAGVKNLQEFVALAKKSPGKVDYASTGAGSASHLAGELFNQRAGVEMVHVPYKGGAPALQDLLGERVTSYFAAPPTALPHVQTGKLIPLATTGLTRPAYMPDIPTVAEAGYPGFEALNWYAFVAPSKTPEPILERWNVEIVKALNDEGVKKALNDHGLTPQPTSRKELAAFIKKEYDQWGRVVKERKLADN